MFTFYPLHATSSCLSQAYGTRNHNNQSWQTLTSLHLHPLQVLPVSALSNDPDGASHEMSLHWHNMPE
jgi:hypothetical protein